MKYLWVGWLSALASLSALAQDSPRIQIEMDATRIKANKELPKLLYIMPWQDTELTNSAEDTRIVVPDLFGDFYDPVPPGAAGRQTEPNTPQEGTIEQ